MAKLPNLALGFVSDAKNLVEEFASEKKFDLQLFADIWKKRHFSMIWLGRPNAKELLEFTNLVFRTTMELFFKETKNIYEHVGYLYLLYALFRYQPMRPPLKVRFPLDNWDSITELRDKAEQDADMHTLFAIRYLIDKGFDCVYETTLMGPCLGATAAEVDMSTSPPEDVDESFDKACKMQCDLETCFQELKIQKKKCEAAFSKLLPEHTPYSLINNTPYQAFLNNLEPYAGPRDRNKEDSIGARRALIKAAAYNKIICRAQKLAEMRAKKRKRRFKKRLAGEEEEEDERNWEDIEEELVELEQMKPKETEPVRKRRQRREKLFKKKYMFQYAETTSATAADPQPGCSKSSK